jgi:hypothetical protein
LLEDKYMIMLKFNLIKIYIKIENNHIKIILLEHNFLKKLYNLKKLIDSFILLFVYHIPSYIYIYMYIYI